MPEHPEGAPPPNEPMNGNTLPAHPHPGETRPILGNNPNTQGNMHENPQRKKNNMRANIKIASINLNGASAPSENMSFLNKWNSISKTVQTEKIVSQQKG